MRRPTWSWNWNRIFGRTGNRQQATAYRRLTLEPLQSRQVLDGETIEVASPVYPVADEPFAVIAAPAPTSGPIEEAVVSQSLSPNPTSSPADVNGSGLVTPIDALQIINWIAASSPTPGNSNPTFNPTFDVNSDQTISETDILLVISDLTTIHQPAQSFA